MEKNGTIYCDECNLDIMRQPHRRLAREPRPGEAAGKIYHFHNRHQGDCWSKVVDRAKAQQTNESKQMKLAFARGSGVIQ